MKQKAQIERSNSQRVASAPNSAVPGPVRRAQPQQPNIDLFGDIVSPPARPNTTEPTTQRAPPPPQQKPKPADSLLGLDFFGGAPTAPARSSSTASNPNSSATSSRPDLKQSILSLYASAPKQQAQPTHDRAPSFGGMTSPNQSAPKSDAFGGLSDAFSGLGFSSPVSTPAAAPAPKPKPAQSPAPRAQPANPSAFANLSSMTNQRSTPAPPQLSSGTSGGGFFDEMPKAQPRKPSQTSQVTSPSNGLDFGFAQAANLPSLASVSSPQSRSVSNDLFDFAASDPPPPPPPKPQSPQVSSAFNLSNPAPAPAPKPAAAPSQSLNFGGWSNNDAWGSNDAWSTPDPTPAPAPAPARERAPSVKTPAAQAPMSNDPWGSFTSPSTLAAKAPQPTVSADEDFGGWNSAVPSTPSTQQPPQNQNQNQTSKPSGGGFGGSDDLFSNVWE